MAHNVAMQNEYVEDDDKILRHKMSVVVLVVVVVAAAAAVIIVAAFIIQYERIEIGKVYEQKKEEEEEGGWNISSPTSYLGGEHPAGPLRRKRKRKTSKTLYHSPSISN